MTLVSRRAESSKWINLEGTKERAKQFRDSYGMKDVAVIDDTTRKRVKV